MILYPLFVPYPFALLELILLLWIWAKVHRSASKRRESGEPSLLKFDFLFVFNVIGWAVILAALWIIVTVATEPDGYNPIWEGFVAWAAVVYAVPLLTICSMTVWSLCGCRLRFGYWLATVGAAIAAGFVSIAVANWAWSIARQ